MYLSTCGHPCEPVAITARDFDLSILVTRSASTIWEYIPHWPFTIIQQQYVPCQESRTLPRAVWRFSLLKWECLIIFDQGQCHKDGTALLIHHHIGKTAVNV